MSADQLSTSALHRPRRRARARHAFTLSCVFVLFGAISTSASPILGSANECRESLQDNRATWTSSEHFQFVAFWDPVAGCDPTIAHPIQLHTWFENFDGLGGLKVETLFDLFPQCGRIQFDAQSYMGPTSAVLDEQSLVSLVFNTGVDCDPGGDPPRPPTSTGDPDPRGSPIPEPASLLLFGTALSLLRRLIQSRFQRSNTSRISVQS